MPHVSHYFLHMAALVHLYGKEFRRVSVTDADVWRTVCECLGVSARDADRQAAISEEKDNAFRIFCYVDEDTGVKPAAGAHACCYATEFVCDHFGLGLLPGLNWDYASIVLAKAGRRYPRPFTPAELAGLERCWLRLLRDVERSEAYCALEDAAVKAGQPLPIEPDYAPDALDEPVSELSGHLEDSNDDV